MLHKSHEEKKQKYRPRKFPFVVFSLIKSGTNLEIQNARQWTALDCAAAFGWEKIARALLEAGANVQPKPKVCTVKLLQYSNAKLNEFLTVFFITRR